MEIFLYFPKMNKCFFGRKINNSSSSSSNSRSLQINEFIVYNALSSFIQLIFCSCERVAMKIFNYIFTLTSLHKLNSMREVFEWLPDELA
jgi:hypothetical protein